MRQQLRPAILALVLLLLGLGAAFIAPPTAAAPPTVEYPKIELSNKPEVIRIGYQAIPNAELIAKQLKWHEDALGVPIEWRQFESGRDVNTAIAGGSIDIGLVGSSPAAAGLSQGLPYDVIAIYDVIGDSEALAVQPEIKSFADLKGKKLAAPFGSTTHYSLLQVLKLNNISPDEVTLIDLNPSDLLAAWTRGDIDAAYVWQPTLQKLYDAGGVKLIGSDEVAAKGFPTFDLAVATKDFSSKYPEAVAVYLQDLSKAVDLYRAAPAQAADLIAKELQITPEEATAQAKGLIWLTVSEQIGPKYFWVKNQPGALGQALKTTADFLVEQQVIRSAPELPVFQQGANPSFLQQAAPPSVYPSIQLTNKPEVIRIGYQAIPNAELIAKQLKWHEDALGVPIEWRQFESGRDVNTAIAGGSIDIGLVGSSPAAAGLSQELPYDVIAIYDVIGDSEALAVRPEIKTFADLKGKKLAAPFGSTTHYSLLQVLKLNNISPDEVTLIDLNPSDLLAAWTRGDIDAAYVWQPTLQKLYDAGGVKLIGSDEVAAKGFPTFDLAVATKDFSSKYPEAVAVYLQNLSKAVDLYRADPAQAAELIATELQITPEEAAAQAKGLIWLTASEQIGPAYFGVKAQPGALGEALKTTGDFLVEQQVIRSAPELPVFQQGANPTFLELAAGQ